MITIRSHNLFQPSAARTSSRFRPNPAINRWAIFNRPRNADSAEPIFWATPRRGHSTWSDGFLLSLLQNSGLILVFPIGGKRALLLVDSNPSSAAFTSLRLIQ